ncbi:LRR repeats and ubiquitin-like domain-containing protein At2g30105 [Pistacia vera]|uniref:LRR repeats and ubiquitin-like domain-containing protein At2g30105 n=1 Tax=Pistacia vera TaxID=55513 RepID=UPI001263A900|nr:LRR repeats and ubiquitin-like domain-containing protein At2g30105 [Pistacia vera]
MEENNINITVKFITESIPITTSHDSTVQQLKTILLPLTSVLPVDQKLIFKGRILENEKSLRESEINNGAKIMLVGTQVSATEAIEKLFADETASRMEESNINITVKFTTQSIPITISHDSTVQRLKTTLLPLISISPHGQKLIFKGRLLEDDESLRQSGINNGATIMLVGTKGFYPGDGPMTGGASSRIASTKKEIEAEKSRTERWKATNIVALAECNLKDIPDEVWPCAPFIRVLDISHNPIQHVPDRIDCLTRLRKLYLNGNGLPDESISWQGITSLKRLQVLSLSWNCLNTLPSTLGLLTSLQQLNVANNLLTALPIEIGNLTELEILKVNNNRISSIPSSIGNCTSLVEVDLSSNHLSELPDEFCSLHNLKALYISNNAMKSLPNSFFMMCTQLSILDHHHTEITMDTLWQSDGWEDFEERRRAKRRKRNDFGVINSAESDEDADKN